MTVAAAAEGMDVAVARAKLYVEAGADAIFPEALTTRAMFEEFAARIPGFALLANMTEFGRTPFFTADEFAAMGYRMVIRPVSSLRVANKAQAELYAAIARDGGTHGMIDRMQTRAELYDTIGLHAYEALDASIMATVISTAMPQPDNTRQDPIGASNIDISRRKETGEEKGAHDMKHPRLIPLALLLMLVACNYNGARAQGDFNSAGNQFGQNHFGSGFNNVGKGFSDGANATGDAISTTVNKIGQSFSQ